MIPTGIFLYQMLVKGFITGILKGTFEIVLQDTFQTAFQTFLVTVADFFGVGHFALFLLFLWRKQCMILQFHLFEKRNL